ncbi:hypothetical protein [Desulfolucanica intricata]|nr:hypothetical protein [Desulfolucanica intricata]
MPKVYLRWEKIGNKLCARWSKNMPRELTIQESGKNNISYKNSAAAIAKV